MLLLSKKTFYSSQIKFFTINVIKLKVTNKKLPLG